MSVLVIIRPIACHTNSDLYPRRHPESPLFLVDTTTSHLLHYAPNPLLPARSRFRIPSSLILDNPSASHLTLQVWSGPLSKHPATTSAGYRDLGVDVCEADVPALFTENFDWNDARRHLVAGVLGSELLGKKIGILKVGCQDEALESEQDIIRSGIPRGMGKGKYIDRVRDTRTFADISRDVLRRWAFPLVPDSRIMGKDDYELRRGNVYVARTAVRLSRTTTTTGPALIGPHTTLSARTTFNTSTIGERSLVGTGTRIVDSYLFDHVTVGNDCVLNGCIVAQNVVIGDRVVIGVGALIGAGVVIGNDEVIEPFARVAASPLGQGDASDSDEDSDDFAPGKCPLRATMYFLKYTSLTLGLADTPPSRPLTNPGSQGWVWPSDEVSEDDGMHTRHHDDEQHHHDDGDSSSEDEFQDPYEHPDNKRLLNLGQDLSRVHSARSVASTLDHSSTIGSDDVVEDRLLAHGVQGVHVGGQDMSDIDANDNDADDNDDDAASSASEEDPTTTAHLSKLSDFRTEVRLSLDRAVEESHRPQDALLELTTLMLSSNVGVSGPGGGKEQVVAFLMDHVTTKTGGDGSVKAVKQAATSVWERWGALVQGIGIKPKDLILQVQVSSHDVCVYADTLADSRRLFPLQYYCLTTSPTQASLFPIHLNALYDADIVEFEDIIAWYKSDESRGKGGQCDMPVRDAEEWKSVWNGAGRFVKALVEAQESSEEEDESDEE